LNRNEISDKLREARNSRDRLFGELANARARGLADGTDPADKVGSLNRDVEAADTRILELEAEYGRMVELEGIAGNQRHREAGTDLSPGEDRVRHRAGGNPQLDVALLAIEQHLDVVAVRRINRRS
jgi:hypothetical protein